MANTDLKVKLHVSNLPSSITIRRLRRVFAALGVIKNITLTEDICDEDDCQVVDGGDSQMSSETLQAVIEFETFDCIPAGLGASSKDLVKPSKMTTTIETITFVDHSVEGAAANPGIMMAPSSNLKQDTATSLVPESNTYDQLMELDGLNLVVNNESFECSICMTVIEKGEGVILRDCLHTFCKECLASLIQYNDEPEVSCPFQNNDYKCSSLLLDREIKALATPEIYERHLRRSVMHAESRCDRAFHCKTPDCPGWCEYDDDVNSFACPVCGNENCLTCKVIHANKNCKQYQDEIAAEASKDENAKKSQEFVDAKLASGEAMRCPQCTIVILEKTGCDWIKCTMCKTELCWVTKGPRWGPGGQGDTSGGCKCRVNGQMCHPNCGNCH